ncbi:MAG: response regulator, partial [Rhodanobacter sp.]
TDKVWGMRQGAKAYVTKPIKEEELVKALKEFLPG